MRSFSAIRVAAFFAACFALSNCVQENQPKTIAEVRTLPAEERIGAPPMDTATRMGLTGSSASGMPPVGVMPPSPSLPESDLPLSGTVDGVAFGSSYLSWQAPASWRIADERPMRLATLVPEGSTQSECAVSALAGPAGGVGPNINRWRAQLSLSPLSDEDIAALPVWDVLQVPSTYVECTGGAPGAASEAYQLFGLICPLPENTLFVKMTGPRAELEREREAFRAFCLSLDLKDTPAE